MDKEDYNIIKIIVILLFGVIPICYTLTVIFNK
jgi:hypothetical protein